MNNKLLTIVIPTYNMENLLGKCLDSLIVENDNLEAIVIIDGGTDKSSTIAHEYEMKYPNIIRVIDKENGGHGSCCNIGLKEAHGKYIHFLDSDDWFDDNLTVFLDRLSSETSDVVFTKRVDELSDTNTSEVHSLDLQYNKKYILSSLKLEDLSFETFSLHECTFSVNLLRNNNVTFLEHCSYDDTILRLAAFPRIKTISLYDLTLYHYLLGRAGQSVERAVFVKKLPQLIDNIIHLFDYCNNMEKDLDENSKIFCTKVLERYTLWIFREMWDCSKNTMDRYNKLKVMNKIFKENRYFHWLKYLRVVKGFHYYPFFIGFLNHAYCYKHGYLWKTYNDIHRMK